MHNDYTYSYRDLFILNTLSVAYSSEGFMLPFIAKRLSIPLSRSLKHAVKTIIQQNERA